MTNATTVHDLDTKIAELQKRVQQKPLTQIDADGDVHIVFQPLPEQPTADLNACFKAIRDNFKVYTTKSKYHINSHFLAPNTEKKVIKRKFSEDRNLQKLSECLNTKLLEFEKNVKRFAPTVKDSGYKLEIKMGGKNNHSISIGFENKDGKQVGPFLETHLTTSPLDNYDSLTVNIGYIDKHKKRVYTHIFDYNLLNNENLLTEQHGDATRIKTASQLFHDKFNDGIIKENKLRLKSKHTTQEL